MPLRGASIALNWGGIVTGDGMNTKAKTNGRRARRGRHVGAALLAATVLSTVSCAVEPGNSSGVGPELPCTEIVEYELQSGGSWASAATVSADGKRVAFVRDGRIVIREIRTGIEYDVTGDLAVGLPFGSLRIAADGEHVGVTLPGIVRPDRDGYVVDVASGEALHLAWPDAQWASGVDGVGFSPDLSTFVFREQGTSAYWVIPSDGTAGRRVQLAGYGFLRMNGDASVLAAGITVDYHGTARTYTGPDADSAQIMDLNRSGSRALITSANKAYFWHIESDTVEALPMAPGEATADPGWARASDNGRFVVRSGNLAGGGWGVWRFDTKTGEVTPLPAIFDGVTGISDDGRVMTSTNRSYFTCEG